MTSQSDSLHPIPVQHSQRDVAPAPFQSILFSEPDTGAIDGCAVPDVFPDLNLNQIVDAITAGREEYDLKPFFYLPLGSVSAINYRYEVLSDLEKTAIADHIRSFANRLRQMRQSLALRDKLYYERQKQRWFLDAVERYCNTVDSLSVDLAHADIGSQGLRSFRGWLSHYSASDTFIELRTKTQTLLAALSDITYMLHIRGRRVTVSKYGSELDYGTEVLKTFAQFSQGATRECRFEIKSSAEMNHVEAAILDLIAELYPDVFSSLEGFCKRHASYLHETLIRFDREVQFYLACLDHVQRFQKAGLAFCHAIVSDRSKEVCGHNVFDLALAATLIQSRSKVVTNDFYLKDPERIFIVTGPNQGGKTTFGRTFAQLHYLASIGCPVPGSDARLFLFDRIFTHFERTEHVGSLQGRLEDELLRVKHILNCATPDSILIMNESFLSTTLNDALFLSKQIMQRIVDFDLLCVSITFLDELASFSSTTVSIVSTVDPKEPTLRTFKLIRKPPDGLAYAHALAEKHHLTFDAIAARISHSVDQRSTK